MVWRRQTGIDPVRSTPEHDGVEIDVAAIGVVPWQPVPGRRVTNRYRLAPLSTGFVGIMFSTLDGWTGCPAPEEVRGQS